MRKCLGPVKNQDYLEYYSLCLADENKSKFLRNKRHILCNVAILIKNILQDLKN